MSRRRRHQAPVIVGGTAMVVIIGGLALLSPYLFRTLLSPKIARDLNNLRQAKYALDGFATDFDGQYPNRDTAWAFPALQPVEPRSANDLFRQLFLSRQTLDEGIFHVRGSEFCSGRHPDGVIETARELDPNRILEGGENGWSYLENQKNGSPPGNSLALGGLKPDGSFQEDLWDGQVLVLTVDGSTEARDPAEWLASTGHAVSTGASQDPILRHPALPSPR